MVVYLKRETDFVGNKNLTFPTDYFHRLIQTLNHYNFTTDESTSSFQQVAIDPEMLGRIFENLLAEQSEETGEQARKAKGAFYTPREIVDYMCRESLREYLKTKIPYDEMRDSKLELLLDKKSHEYRDQQKNFRQYLKNYKSDIIDALDDLKVLDPACGSGAFPMGMLQLLVQVYERLEPRFDQYETKVSIVKNNIYGVDIEPMAVEISRLRTWLSIIVDEEVDSNKVKPLPNLDFKFVCANSLIPLDQNGAQGLLDDSDLEEKLVEIREKYFNARTHNSKKNLKDKLNKLIGYSSNGKQLSGFKSNRQLQLESYQPFNPENSTEFFDAEFMFGVSKFNVIVGNPPYVSALQSSKSNNSQREILRNHYPKLTGAFDLYVAFILKSKELLAESGITSLIIPNKFIIADYSKKTLEYLKSTGELSIFSVSSIKVFDAASVYPIIMFFQNSNSRGEYKEYFFERIADVSSNKPKSTFRLDFPDNAKKLSQIGINISAGTTGFMASQVKELVSENPNDTCIEFTVSGNVDRYKYTNDNVAFMKKRYKKAYVEQNLDIISKSKINMWRNPKIVIAGMTKRIEAVYVTNPLGLGVGIYALFDFPDNVDPYYLLALLNSRFMSYYLISNFKEKHLSGGYLAINKSTLSELPIIINSSSPVYQELITESKKMQDINTNPEQGSIIDKKIDELVYKLYEIPEYLIEKIEKFYGNEAN